jgi:hypothetical protein
MRYLLDQFAITGFSHITPAQHAARKKSRLDVSGGLHVRERAEALPMVYFR